MSTKFCIQFLGITLTGMILFSSCQTTAPTYKISSYLEHKSSPVIVAKQGKNPTTPAVSSLDLRSDIIAEAKKYLGKTYVYGGKTPDDGFDCSGLLTYIFNKNGVDIEGSSDMLAQQGEHRETMNTQIGDLAFFGTEGIVSHVALVIDKSPNSMKVIHSTSNGGVRIDDIFSSLYWRNKYLYTRSVID